MKNSMFIKLEWDRDLGEKWMNIDNLKLLLYGKHTTKKKLLKVTEIKEVIKSCK
ncbi:hypothetical protein LCGC14_2576450 [marine sediment metagenome]|uniref:Uncharacterized protein n=1 Tax=marine sediment metagenome TaxID=412755 RepID=A0A0F9D8E9_9ZZZZ